MYIVHTVCYLCSQDLVCITLAPPPGFMTYMLFAPHIGQCLHLANGSSLTILSVIMSLFYDQGSLWGV